MTSPSSPAMVPSQIGRFGTLSLLKHNSPSPGTVLTSFGIDATPLTFGRDPNCGVRLYYPEVDLVHARIDFDEEMDRKAFLCVLGEKGVGVDGCWVKPEMTTTTTVPLVNGSEFEIRGKKFRFTYPPKEMRAVLSASPIPTRRPRLSLITSTNVFSPRPFADPRENLRVLKSPLRNTFKSPRRLIAKTPLPSLLSKYAYSSPMKPSQSLEEDEDDEEEEENIVLVDGNHPRVVEDEKDLIILEDIETLPKSHHVVPSQAGLFPSSPSQSSLQLHAPQPVHHQQQQQAPKTPTRKRSQSLHRAVLIRSAQRAVFEAERDEMDKEEEERERQEEEMEEMEVADAVAGLDAGYSHSLNKDYDDEVEDEGAREYSEDVEMDVDVEDEAVVGMEMEAPLKDEETETTPRQQPKLNWRKSFERLWPFRSSSPVKHEEEEDKEDSSEEEDEREQEQREERVPQQEQKISVHEPRTSPSKVQIKRDEDEEESSQSQTLRTPSRPGPGPHRALLLGNFMTPGPQRMPKSNSEPTLAGNPALGQPVTGTGGNSGPGRFSLGGEARRVVRPEHEREMKWRVRDIVVPTNSNSNSGPITAIADSRMGASGTTTTTTCAGAGMATPTATALGSQPDLKVMSTPRNAWLKGAPSTSPRKGRAAIQERRRSAVREGGGLGFVPGMGMSPLKPPKTPYSTSSSRSLFQNGSPAKSGSIDVGFGIGMSEVKEEVEPGVGEVVEEEEEDTRKLLERMNETVEGMKRRRSEVNLQGQLQTPRRGRSPSPGRFSLLRQMDDDMDEDKVGEKEGKADVNRHGSPVKVEPPAQAQTPMRGRSTTPSRMRMSPAPVFAPSQAAEEMEEVFVQTQPTRRSSPTKMAMARARSTTPKRMSPAPTAVPMMVVEEGEPEADTARDGEEDRDVLMGGAETETEMDIPDVPAVVVEEQEAQEPEPEPVEEPEAKPRSRSKPPSRTATRPATTTRSRSKPPSVNASAAATLKPPSTTTTGRRTRASPSPAPLEEEQEQKQPDEKLKVTGKRAVGRKATTPTPTPVSEPVKRGRKPAGAVTVEPALEDESEEAKEVPKRGRKLGLTSVASTAVKAQEKGKASTATTATGRKVVASGSRKVGTPASAPTAPAKTSAGDEKVVKRGRTPRAADTASKTQADEDDDAEETKKAKVVPVKGRKRAGTVVKHEEDGDDELADTININGDVSLPPVPAATKSRTLKSSATTTTTTRGRKTPAPVTEPLPTLAQAEVNKENETSEGKVRVSRKTTKGRAAGKDNEEGGQSGNVEEVVVKGKKVSATAALRATRARTRT
ncbi:hypothetical protein H0H93_005119, partial [Arthromyces matolae]